MKTEKWIEVVILIVLVLSVSFVAVLATQEKKNGQAEWINWPKLYNDCAKKVSIEHSNYCAEIDSLECFERCLK